MFFRYLELGYGIRYGCLQGDKALTPSQTPRADTHGSKQLTHVFCWYILPCSMLKKRILIILEHQARKLTYALRIWYTTEGEVPDDSLGVGRVGVVVQDNFFTWHHGHATRDVDIRMD